MKTNQDIKGKIEDGKVKTAKKESGRDDMFTFKRKMKEENINEKKKKQKKEMLEKKTKLLLRSTIIADVEERFIYIPTPLRFLA